MYLTTSVALLLCETLCLASLLTQDQTNTEKNFFTDKQKSELKDVLSKYKHTASKKDETIEIAKAVSQCFNIFNDNGHKGWSSPPSPTCATPGSQCTIDYRNMTAKHSIDPNNDGGSSPSTRWDNPRGWNSNGWSGSSSNSSISKTCCNEDICTNGFCCTPAPASSTHSICKMNSDCCGFMDGISQCSTTLGICLLTLGTTCSSTNQCISGICDGTCCYPSGTCMPPNEMCISDKQCCGEGVCHNGTCLTSTGGNCTCTASCSNPAASCDQGKCCLSQSTSCSFDSDCCGDSSVCNSVSKKCDVCQGAQGTCGSSTTCCNNLGCNDSKCCNKNGQCNVSDSPSVCCAGYTCAMAGVELYQCVPNAFVFLE